VYKVCVHIGVELLSFARRSSSVFWIVALDGVNVTMYGNMDCDEQWKLLCRRMVVGGAAGEQN